MRDVRQWPGEVRQGSDAATSNGIVPSVFAGIMGIAAMALLMPWAGWWTSPKPKVAADGVVVVRVPELPSTIRPPRATRPVPVEPEDPETPPETLTLIQANLHDAGATLRNVRPGGAGGEVYCGEVSTSAAPQFRRFVWLASVRMMATDDGGADFVDLARLCAG